MKNKTKLDPWEERELLQEAAHIKQYGQKIPVLIVSKGAGEKPKRIRSTPRLRRAAPDLLAALTNSLIALQLAFPDVPQSDPNPLSKLLCQGWDAVRKAGGR